ncbi:MAG: hypothetical protein HZB38_01515 [Planctomycetes bacterium]|nr:hypothetical protein [Planctomycetota bacterium]
MLSSIVCSIGVLPCFAFGQGATSPILSRPSEQGPSTVLGRVGGTNTRYSSSVQDRFRARFAYGNAATNFYSARSFGGGRGAASAGRRTMPLNIFGGRRRFGGGSGSGGGLSPFAMGNLFQVSGMDEATSFEIPVGGIPSARIDLSNSAVYIPPSDSTAFHDFFGLKPTREQAAPETVNPQPSASDLLGKVNDKYVAELVETGKREFKLGTTLGLDDRGEHLSRALNLFESARKLDKSAWIPGLLSAAAALEKNRTESAISALREAVSRNARAIADRPDIPGLYGTASMFEATMRKYYLAAGATDVGATSLALEAYFALLANDKSRAETALNRLEAQTRLQSDATVQSLVRSLRVALQ